MRLGDFMEKSILKSFATESRNHLIEDVIYRLNLIGITENEIHESISDTEGIETFQMGNATFSIYDDDIENLWAFVYKENNHYSYYIATEIKEIIKKELGL